MIIYTMQIQYNIKSGRVLNYMPKFLKMQLKNENKQKHNTAILIQNDLARFS
jgi:hypothetical protein